jgi:serine/threonine protein kinase
MTQFEPVRFGKYLVLNKVAVGGMAELFQAKITSVEGFEKLVAIKKILPHLTNEENLVSMFIDEAKLAAMLTHQNIVQIYDLGSLEGTYYIAMEFIHGKDLRTILDKSEATGLTIPLEQALHIICRVCAGLDYSHNLKDFQGNSLNLIHRDISPQNILVSYEGEVKIVDFGIAKAATKSTETRVGVIKGKLAYMSPEQASLKSIDHRSDIFSAGIVLYEMITGKRMFDGSDLEVLDRVREAEFEPPEMIVPDLPPRLYEILYRALAKNVDLRYQSGAAMLADLEACLSSSFSVRPSAESLSQYMKKCFAEEIAAEALALQRIGTEVPSEEITAPKDPTPTPTDRTMTVSTGPAKPKRHVWLAVLAVLGVAIAAILVFVLREQPAPKPTPPVTKPSPPAPTTPEPTKLDQALEALKNERFAEAVQQFEQALADNPANMEKVATPYSQALQGLALSLMGTNPQQAKDLLSKSIEVDPRNDKSHFYLGKVYTSLKEYPQAIESYEKAISLNPQFPDTFFNLGFLYSLSRDYTKAESMFREVIALSPPYLDEAYFNLAVVQMKQRKKQESIQSLEQALKINPQNAKAEKFLLRLKKK